MKPASISDLKRELKERDPAEVLNLCLAMARFKKENKEFLTYLVFEKENEADYVDLIKTEIDDLFDPYINGTAHFTSKQARKILRIIKKYIRFSKNKETETQLLLKFCQNLVSIKNRYTHKRMTNTSISMRKILNQQISLILKAIDKLEEDLQYDYKLALDTFLNSLKPS